MTLLEVVTARPCQTYADVLSRLQAVNAALPPDDGLRWFGTLYLDMTTAVASHAQAGGFRAPKFLEALDCAFADLYFAALALFLRDPDSTPGAWSPLFDRRSAPDITSLQFAIAGVNAHINRDLPVALVGTFERFAIVPSREDVHYADYRAVDRILAAVHAKVKATLVTGLLAAGDVALGPIDDAVELWSLEHARDAAWHAAELRWYIRGSELLSVQHLATLDGLVGLASRGILRPGLAWLT